MSIDIYGSGGNISGSGSYEHVQDTPASMWDIIHNLGFHPNVTVVDSAGSEVEGDVKYPSSNEVQIEFASAFSGQAFLS